MYLKASVTEKESLQLRSPKTCSSWGQAGARSQDLGLNLPHGLRGPCSWAVTRCFLRCIRSEQAHKQCIQNQCSCELVALQAAVGALAMTLTPPWVSRGSFSDFPLTALAGLGQEGSCVWL